MNSISFKNLDITINKGELIGIIGQNGCGKTIFLKMISGRIKNDYFYIDKKSINSYDLNYKRNNIVCVFDDNIYNTNSVKDELKYYLNILNINFNRVNDFIEYFNLYDLIDNKFDNMTIENRIYIKILSLLIINPSIFCIDDLLCYLSIDKKMRILNYIKENDITLLNVTSDMEELILYDKILIMNKGKKEVFDKTENVLNNEIIFRELGLSLPFIYDINNMLISYDLIKENHYNDKDLVDLLWK